MRKDDVCCVCSYCKFPHVVVLTRSSPSDSWGFALVGGLEEHEVPESADSPTPKATPAGTPIHALQELLSQSPSRRVSPSPPERPPLVKTVVPGGVAYREGRMRCGDFLLAVGQHNVERVPRVRIVHLLKQALTQIQLTLLSWPGTVV